jgi:alkylhydroperoxidase family enzyme
VTPRSEARVPRLPVDEAKAAADEAGVPDYMAELAIMRIAWLTACEYEWSQHWRVAQGLGVSADDLAGVRDWHSYKAFRSAERAVLAATDDVVRDGAVGAESWAACKKDFGANQATLVELVTAISAWRMVASILQSLKVPLEDDVASWPPDGRPPGDSPFNVSD